MQCRALFSVFKNVAGVAASMPHIGYQVVGVIAGEKDPRDFFLRRDNADIRPETMFFKLNPALHNLFDVVVINDFDKGEIEKGQFSVARLGLMFNNLEYAKEFVYWATTYDAFDHFTHADEETDPGAGALKYFAVTLEETELRLLSITTPLPEYGIRPLAAQYVLNENQGGDDDEYYDDDEE